MLNLTLKWILLLSRAVPSGCRAEWREEWETELCCDALRHEDQPRRRNARLAWRAAGALIDAAWMLREEWRWDVIRQDLKFAARLLFFRKPGLTVSAGLVLAIAVGAATAIFSVVHAVVLAPLPFERPARLVSIWEQNPEKDWYQETAAPANFLDWKARSETISAMAAYGWTNFLTPLTGDGEPEMLRVRTVTEDFFDVLGVAPMLGRTLREGETWADSEPVAVLSHGLWQRRFGSDPQVVERLITLDEEKTRIVGVMPPGFRFPDAEVELWTPFRWRRENREAVWFRRAHFVNVIGRLAPGATRTQAEEELAAIASALAEEYPETNRLMGNGITPLHEWVVGNTETVLWLLLGSVGLILLMACANVANLLLARSSQRLREMAVRSTFGADRFRLLRQLVIESLLLATVGGAVGVALAGWLVRGLVALSPPDLPRLQEVAMSRPVLGFALGLTLLTSLLFGLMPALRQSRAGTAEALKDARHSSDAARLGRARTWLVAAQLALALVVVVGAGLMGRSLYNLHQVDPGFSAHDRFTFGLSLPSSRYPDSPHVVGFFSQLEERLSALPQVWAAGSTSTMALTGHGWTGDYFIEGRPAGEYGVEVVHRRVTPGYFEAAGVPLLAGRYFSRRDRDDAEPVVIVNQAFASKEFGEGNPIGQRVAFTRTPQPDTTWRTIVGVVGDEKQEELTQPARPEIFEPHRQATVRSMYVVVRHGPEAANLPEVIRSVVRELDADLPIYRMRSMQDIVAQSTVRSQFLVWLFSAFAWTALALAMVGVYGVASYAVNTRMREIGIRMALGAGYRQVLALILRQGAAMVLAGVALGLPAALFFSRYLSSQLFEVGSFDPVTLIGVALLLVLTGLAACLFPARRGARSNPASLLKVE